MSYPGDETYMTEAQVRAAYKKLDRDYAWLEKFRDDVARALGLKPDQVSDADVLDALKHHMPMEKTDKENSSCG